MENIHVYKNEYKQQQQQKTPENLSGGVWTSLGKFFFWRMNLFLGILDHLHKNNCIVLL